MDEMNQYSSFEGGYAERELTLNQYISRTFGWMFLGLIVTFALAWFLSATGTAYTLCVEPAILTLLLIAELVVVIVFSSRILKQSVGVSRVLFLVYSLLNGVVFSTYFVLFDVVGLTAIFGLTALFFGAFAIYGRFTRADLSRLRPLLIGGLIFLVVAALLSFLIDMSSMERLICMIGIVIFLGFTAYDTQKIKANYEYFCGNGELLKKASIYSALQLYLDFINLFLYLLRFLGRSKR